MLSDSMEWFQLFTVLAIQMYTSMATRILYVLPDNSTNASCPFQPCATLSEYLLDNGSLPVVSNVQYYFLPGEHLVPANMLLQDLCNFSIIGTVKESPLPVVLVGCLQSHVINVTNSYNVIIGNVMLKQCTDQTISRYSTTLLIDLCYSCTIENVVFMNSGLKGTNLIGKSHFTKIIIQVNYAIENLHFAYCQGITLSYQDKPAYKNYEHILIMNQIYIIGEDTGNIYSPNPVGIHISITIMENLLIVINNSMFYNLRYTAISIDSRCQGNNTVIIENCTFEQNKGNLNTVDIPRHLINIALSHHSKSVIFKHCNFKNNHYDYYLISITLYGNQIHQEKHCTGPLTNITFLRCQFTKNSCDELLYIRGRTLCKCNLFIIGPSHFVTTPSALSERRKRVFLIINMVVHLIGPVIMSSNIVMSVMFFDSCEVIFQKDILIKSNICLQVITLYSSFIKLMEYSNLTLLKNKHIKELIQN